MNETDRFDARRFKRLERDGYERIAARYAAAAEARRALALHTLARAALAPRLRVLDLASGPALLAGEAAAAVGDAGLVVASDLAPGVLACAAPGSGVMRVAADAERLPFADAGFDRVLCGLGLMFFPHAPAALAQTLRVLAPGGLALFSVWGEEREVPLVACALACLRRLLPPPRVARPSVFRFGDAALLAQTFGAAGFERVDVEAFALESRFDSAPAYWQAFLDLAGGAAGSIAGLPPAMQQRLPQEVARELAPYAVADGYRMASRVLLVRAGRPARGGRV